jgi:hypothetical protein
MVTKISLAEKFEAEPFIVIQGELTIELRDGQVSDYARI